MKKDRIQGEVLFIDVSQCARRYSISNRAWTRLVAKGEAPSPVKFGRLTRWSIKSLEEWESRKEKQ